MRIIPDIPPKLFTLSAIAVGYILIDDTTANEQNALGNWLMLTAQVLCTNAFYKQVQAERNITNMQSNMYSQNNYFNYNKNGPSKYENVNNNVDIDNNNNNNDNLNNNINDSEDVSNIDEPIEMIKKMINAMQQELKNLEKSNS